MIGLVALLATASAATFDLCVEVDAYFYDVYEPSLPTLAQELMQWPQSEVGDIWKTQAARPYRGGRIRYRAQGSADPWSYAYLGNEPNTGCITVNLPSGVSYDVGVMSQAQVNGHTITVHPADDRSLIRFTNFVVGAPVGGAPPVMLTVTSPKYAIVATAAFALHREDGGLHGIDLHINHEHQYWHSFDPLDPYSEEGEFRQDHTAFLQPAQPNPCGQDEMIASETAGTAVSDDLTGDLCVLGDTALTKHIVTHEMGHHLVWHALGAVPEYEYDFDTATAAYEEGPCKAHNTDGDTLDKHDMFSTEWSAAAWMEGFAHAYAALTWNHHGYFDDCAFYYYKPMDLDRDGLEEAHRELDCDLHAVGTSETYGPTDYMGDGGCRNTGGSPNRSTEYDWLRFYWDLITDQGLGYDELLEIAVLADPADWQEEHAYMGTSPDWPANRLAEAAATYGTSAQDPNLAADWNYEASRNGVDR